MTSSPPGVLFDIDGTLCDTNYLHTVAWSRALVEVGEQAASSTIHHHIGMGSDRMLEAALGHDSEAASKAYDRHFKAFEADIRAFPGAADLLRTVSKRGARVVLATSAKPQMLKMLRSAIDAEDVLDGVTSSGDVNASKPAPDIFEAAMESAGLEASRCIAVGDTVWDVRAANQAGVECIALLTGGIAREVLVEAGAVAVYQDPQDLLDNLAESPIGKLVDKSAE